MTNITVEIKDIIFNYIDNEYKNYLNCNNILMIKEDNIYNILNELYEKNIKNIKNTIREKLKNTYKNDYPSATVENIIFDIFQDKELNIIKLVDEIKIIQKKNLYITQIPIINNSLNLNISIINNFIVINSIKNKLEEYKELYDKILEYKFIYSINNKILEEYDNKINIIKHEIFNNNNNNNNNDINIGLYYLKLNT